MLRIFLLSTFFSIAFSQEFSISFGEVDEAFEGGVMEIIMTNTLPVGGFQLELSGIDIDSVSGGLAAENGFILNNSSSVVMGYSLDGTTILSNSEPLVYLNGLFAGQTVCFENVILSSSEGEPYYAEVGECWISESILGCTDIDGCNYNPEATMDDGSCFYMEDNDWCDCDGSVEDCTGECGGDIFFDACGECGGDNSSCSGCTDPEADNYDPDAIVDDHSCEYPSFDGMIVINEINYNPAQSFDQEDADYEFIELYNNGNDSIDLNEWNISSQNIDFSFEEYILEPGEYILLARNVDTYPGSIGYGNSDLSNSGETITLTDSNGQLVDVVTYSDGFQGDDDQWPQGADAEGATLELINANSDNNVPESWQASYIIPGGTPGYENSLELGGCTDTDACNFDPEATLDDGSCWYPYDMYGCYFDINGNGQYDEGEEQLADGLPLTEEQCYIVISFTWGLFSTYSCEESMGCTDLEACNYSSIATYDDGSCEYPEEYYDCEGNCIEDTDLDGLCNELDPCPECAENDSDGNGICQCDEVFGCMDELTCNFNPEANVDDGSCDYESCLDCNNDLFGEATLDECGLCSGGDTGLEPQENCTPIITQISDIPNDQGGRVYLNFSASSVDTDSILNRVELYSVERLDFEEWIMVTSGLAYGQDEYIFEVTTIIDSNSVDLGITTFRVLASMDEGIWVSEESTGFSIDNIAPNTPDNLSFEVNSEASIVSLTWDLVDANDLDYYAIYRSVDEVFTSNEILTQTYESTYIDENVEGAYFYSVSAFDVNGNESPLSESVEVSTEDLANDDLMIPTEFALEGCYPNPFNPLTNINFTVPFLSKVLLEVYTINGNYICKISENYHQTGHHGVTWDARGQASGVYIIKMSSDGFSQSQKIMLIK